MSTIYPFNETNTEALPSPQVLKSELPTTIAQQQFIEQSRKEIAEILAKTDQRTLMILGPCSIHDSAAAEHYGTLLSRLTAEVGDTFFPVMRVYFEKPRTKAGWKGLMNDPFLDGSNDLQEGIRLTRRLLLKLTEHKVPVAAEILEPLSARYFGDLISWGCIGARTASSQIHRQVSSGLPFPVAFKNNTDGNVQVAVDGVFSASLPHTYIGIDEQGRAAMIHTSGNPHGHIVLRGGDSGPNYDAASIALAVNLLQKNKLKPSLIVDCSHGNSGRDHNLQAVVFQAVLEQMLHGNQHIRGMILESHINAGNQALPGDKEFLKYAVSITDPCIDWEMTEALVKDARKKLKAELKLAASV